MPSLLALFLQIVQYLHFTTCTKFKDFVLQSVSNSDAQRICQRSSYKVNVLGTMCNYVHKKYNLHFLQE